MAFLRLIDGLWLLGNISIGISALVRWPKFGGGVLRLAFLRRMIGPLSRVVHVVAFLRPCVEPLKLVGKGGH